jgi:hypothetical protein
MVPAQQFALRVLLQLINHPLVNPNVYNVRLELQIR